MTLTDLNLPDITFKKAAHYTEGRTEIVKAFVNHRMVGYLAGTDAYFTNPATRNVSTHFGIGFGSNGIVKISQYVPLDDTAYGNGNYDASGNWDNWGYKTSAINAQTISIEHQDHGDPTGQGVVAGGVMLASQKLQALLRYGSLTQWKNAGIVIRDWGHNAPILFRELHAIPVDNRHIVTHHDIAGRLKPYCWMPWKFDKVGFPRTQYVTEIKYWGNMLQNGPGDIVTPPPPIVTPPVTFTQTEVDSLIAAERATADKRVLLAKQEMRAKMITFVGTL